MSVPTSHKASILPEAKAKLVVEDRATPSINSDEVLIKITATAINPVDWKIRDYGFLLSSFPALLGSDGAGEIVAVGENVTHLQKGDRAFFQGIYTMYDNSTFQQYAKMPSKLVAKTPKNITDDEAAGISVASIAAVVGLYDKTGQGITPPWDSNGEKAGHGKAAIVLGGSSSVGQYAIQFARLSGFERIITSSSPQHSEFLKSLGATTVLDRSNATAKGFKDAVGGLEVAFVQDGISSKDTQILGVEILREFQGGNIITVLEPNKEAVELGQQEGQKPVSIKSIMGAGAKPELQYLSVPLWENLGGDNGYLAKGKFIPNRPEVVPGGLNGLEEAFARNKSGVSGKKVVIRPHETVA